jgi:arsenate reductase (thioredoxin)
MTPKEDRLRILRDLLLRTTTAQLTDRFHEHFTKETIHTFVEEVYDDLDARFKVKTHIPTFTFRFAKERLDALAKHEGMIVDHQPTVLFVCHRNDAISQMAAALFRARVADRATVHSAGTRPAGELRAAAVQALHEVGLDLLDEFPKPLSLEIERAADVIVTLDAHDRIELVEDDTTQYYAWRISEDHGDDVESYQALRAELEPLVDALALDVTGTPAEALRV